MKTILVFVAVLAVALAAPNAKPLKFRNLYKNPVVDASHFKPSGRIINGEVAEPHSIPYQAFLEVYDLFGGWYCGGSLIAEDVVLTAGHCGDGASEAQITLGAQNALNPEDDTVIVTSTDIRVHEDFDISEIINDICVMKLSKKVELTDNINVAKLANGSDQYVGKTGKVSGWGLTKGGGSELAEELMYTENPILSNDECAQIYGTIPDTQICMSGEGGHSSCNGDSGGPLTVDGVQVGVVSYGIVNCPAGIPSVFTRVTSFAKWIEDNSQ